MLIHNGVSDMCTISFMPFKITVVSVHTGHMPAVQFFYFDVLHYYCVLAGLYDLLVPIA